MFSFENGGWNTVYAKSIKEANAKANEEYKDSKNCNVRPDSMRVATRDAIESAMSNFW